MVCFRCDVAVVDADAPTIVSQSTDEPNPSEPDLDIEVGPFRSG